MKFFVRNCNKKSLLLIDEFGSGTEPQIGAAIAESLLDRFNGKESFGVITTHNQNLKHFANENVGVVNGAMLYDRHEMNHCISYLRKSRKLVCSKMLVKIGFPRSNCTSTEIVGAIISYG